MPRLSESRAGSGSLPIKKAVGVDSLRLTLPATEAAGEKQLVKGFSILLPSGVRPEDTQCGGEESFNRSMAQKAEAYRLPSGKERESRLAQIASFSCLICVAKETCEFGQIITA